MVNCIVTGIVGHSEDWELIIGFTNMDIISNFDKSSFSGDTYYEESKMSRVASLLAWTVFNLGP